jgi:hypothetical protein
MSRHRLTEARKQLRPTAMGPMQLFPVAAGDATWTRMSSQGLAPTVWRGGTYERLVGMEPREEYGGDDSGRETATSRAAAAALGGRPLGSRGGRRSAMWSPPTSANFRLALEATYGTGDGSRKPENYSIVEIYIYREYLILWV